MRRVVFLLENANDPERVDRVAHDAGAILTDASSSKRHPQVVVSQLLVAYVEGDRDDDADFEPGPFLRGLPAAHREKLVRHLFERAAAVKAARRRLIEHFPDNDDARKDEQ